MPVFPLIEPVNVSKHGSDVKEKTGDILEENARLTLSNVIHQLSNVILRGGEIFQSLLDETSKLNEKYNAIRTRLDSLRLDVDKLDPESDKTTQRVARSGWRSDRTFSYQKVFVRETLSKALREQYNRCEPPPPFAKLFGDILYEGQDPVSSQELERMYTNPSYFQEVWLKLKRQERVKKRIKKNKLARLQDSDVTDTLENNEEFYPVQIQREKPPQVIRFQRKELPSGSGSQSPHLYAVPSATVGSQAAHEYAEPVIPSWYNTGQGSYDDGASIVYEVFDSEAPEREDMGSDNRSAVVDGKFIWQCPNNYVLDSSFVETGILKKENTSGEESISTKTDKEASASVISKRDSRHTPRRESTARLKLQNILLERRRCLTVESSSTDDDYTQESSSESEEGDSSQTGSI